MFGKKMRQFLFGLAAAVFAAAGAAAASFPAIAATAVMDEQMIAAGPGAVAAAAAQEDDTTAAQPEMGARYWIYNNGHDWSPEMKDNTYAQSPAGSYTTAIWVTLEHQPALTGTIAYQVNLSGHGWMEWKENSVEAGNSAGNMPLEAVRIDLTGQLKEQYDVYYSVLQNGAWTALAMNGETAGAEGQGLRVDGLRVAIRRKGAGAPEEPTAAGPACRADIDPTRPMIALTFDDGPSGATPRILDSLEANGARATFYMVGNRMNSYPDVVRRIAAGGNEIGSHTWAHTYLSGMSAAAIHGSLNQFDGTLQSIAGIRSTTMRPPGGYHNPASRQALAAYGVPAIMWSIDTLDWKTRNPQATIDSVLSQVQDGDIILMHDLYGTTADAVAVLVPELIARGYQLVTVSELAACHGGMQAGQVYHHFR